MLFELINGAKEGKQTHAGVLEFIAEEGKIYLPYWVHNSISYFSPFSRLTNHISAYANP